MLQHLLPNFCLLCKHSTGGTLALCQHCLEKLPWRTGPFCIQCGISLPHTTLCGTCLNISSAFRHVISPFHYQKPIDHFIQQLKFSHRLIYAHVLGNLLAQYVLNIGAQLPEIIIPVPLHSQRLRERGFNQALEITKSCARQLKIPYCRNTITRNKATQPQTQLNAEEREANVKNAFHIKKQIPYAHIAIIDDVMTTGATLQQLSQTIKNNSQVQCIDLWCNARATAIKNR